MGVLDQIDELDSIESALGEEFEKNPNPNQNPNLNNNPNNNNGSQIPIDDLPFMNPQQPLVGANQMYPNISNQPPSQTFNQQVFPPQPLMGSPQPPPPSIVTNPNHPVVISPYQNVNVVYQNQNSMSVPTPPYINADAEFYPCWTPPIMYPNIPSYGFERVTEKVDYMATVPQQVLYVYAKKTTQVDDDLLIHLTQCKGLQFVNLSECHFRLDLLLRAVSNWRMVRGLNLSDCLNVNDDCVKQIAKNMPQLEEIHLNGCFQLTDDSISYLVEKCPRIRILSLGGCLQLTDRSILQISLRLGELQSLCINKIKNITEKSLSELKKFTSMRSFFAYSTMISDAVLSELALKWRGLEVLNIGKCTNITDTSISTVAFHCHTLQKLFIMGNRNISKLSIILITQNCPLLRVLRIDNCTSLNEEAILALEGKRSLEILNISGLRRLNEHALIKILPTLPSLIELYAYQSPRITNATLVELARSKPSLRVFRVDNSYFPNDEGVIAISQGCREITTLNLSSLPITDASLISIAENMRGLRKLFLNECKSIGDSGLVAVTGITSLVQLRIDRGYQFSTVALEHLSRLVNLTTLNVSGCTNLLDQTVELIVSTCRMLTHFYLTGCVQITGAPIPHLLANLVYLKCLRIDGCPNVTQQSFANILYPHNLPLEVLNVSDTAIGDEGIATILRQSSLRELYAWNCNITDNGCTLMANHLSHLRVLRVDRNKLITDKGIKTLIVHAPLLHTVNIGHTSKSGDDAIYALASHSKYLTKIYASHSDAGERAFTKMFNNCTLLKHVDISRCKKITDSTLIELSMSLHGLTRFICAHNDSISNASIIKISVGCPRLKTVSFEHCKGVGEIGILALSTYCKQIRSLKVTGCPQVTDLAIIGIGRECLGLRALHAGGTGISNGAIIELSVRENIYLDDLDLKNAKQIGSDSFRVLANNCLSLTHLNLTGTGVNSEIINLIKNNCRLLTNFEK